MSISSNYIRGPVNTGQTAFMVMRRRAVCGTANTGAGTLYGMMMRPTGTVTPTVPNDGVYGITVGYSEYRTGDFANMEPCVYSYNTVGSKVTFDHMGVAPGFTTHAATSGTPMATSTVAGTNSVILVPSNSKSQIELSPHSRIPTDQIYAGVWYDLQDEHGNVIEYPWFRTRSGITSGYNPHAISASNPDIHVSQVQFVPFSKGLSLTMAGVTTQVSSFNSAITYIDAWIRESQDHQQNGCSSSLTDPAAMNCLYTDAPMPGMGDHQSVADGWAYCDTNQTCGKCYGVCSSGKQCIYNESLHSYGCGPPVVKPNNTKNKIGWMTVVLIVTIVLIGIGIMYFWKHMKDKNNNMSGKISMG